MKKIVLLYVLNGHFSIFNTHVRVLNISVNKSNQTIFSFLHIEHFSNQDHLRC